MLVDLIKLTEDEDKYPHVLALATVEKINKGVFTHRERGQTQCSMFAYNNLLADVRTHIKNALERSADILRMLLGESGTRFRKNLLSEDKHYKTLC